MKDKKLLMIPGPIEFETNVLQAMGEPTSSHVAPDFIELFGDSLRMMKKVWQCPSGQAFIIAGSGTLAMEIAGANLIETGDRVLVISTGYFGERFADLLMRYGAKIKVLRSSPGEIVKLNDIERELKVSRYKALTFTHVDTSTAVSVDPVPIGKLGQKYGVLTILDGVCSVAGEEIRQEDWGLDIVLTASQKAIGVPPGLALLVASPRAMEVWKGRKTQVGNYYADWTNWLPVMKAYESGSASYFGTPAVNLVSALNVSLKNILDEGLEKRFERHRVTGAAFRDGIHALGLGQIPVSNDIAANTLSAPRYPEGLIGTDLLKEVNHSGVILAGGLHPDLKNEYFRIGHMGSVSQEDILATFTAIEEGLQKCNYQFEYRSGYNAAFKILNC